MEKERQRIGRLDRAWFALRKDSHHSVPRTLGKLDNKDSSNHSPAHSLDRLVSLHRSSGERPRRPSRLDFVNSNDVFVLEKPRKIVSRNGSPEKCDQECLCVVRNAPRKYEEIRNPALTWAFKDKCDDFHTRIEPKPESEPDRSNCLEKPSPIHSDDGNSPTALNTSRLLTEKPPLVKTLLLDYTDPGFNSLRRQRDTCEKVRHRDPQSSLPPIPTNLKNGQNGTPPSSGDCGQQAPVGDLPPELADLRTAPWFQAGLPREAALLLLSRQPEGSFLVRCSTSQPGSLALSLRVPRDVRPCGLAHYLIVKSPRGYKIKGFTKEFGSVRSLVTHHSVMPELLPLPLSLARPQQMRDSSGNFADLSEPEYNTLTDFRKLMADLHV